MTTTTNAAMTASAAKTAAFASEREPGCMASRRILKLCCASTHNFSADQPLKFAKRIGSTSYIVFTRFNKAAKETCEDKILRLIESEVCSLC